MYNWFIIYTIPGDDCLFTCEFYNRDDVDEWLRRNETSRAVVVYGRIETTEHHQ